MNINSYDVNKNSDVVRFPYDEFCCHVVSGQMVKYLCAARYDMAEAYSAS